MQRTEIAWTDFTSNPLQYRTLDGKSVWACIHKSEGCRNCYAEQIGLRFKRATAFSAENMKNLTPFLNEKELHHMLTYKPASGKRCFVGDMTDLFGEWVPFDLLDKLFAVFALRPDITWQLLTKRPERMYSFVRHKRDLTTIFGKWAITGGGPHTWPFPNVWMGVSVENQDTLYRIDTLKDIPAALRFVSFEPLLEDLGALILDGISWSIIGGESGPNARPCNLWWIRNVRDECKRQNLKCFIKQVGGNLSDIDLTECARATGRSMHDHKGGNPAEWSEDLRVREFPQ